ncbi:hypothetical protein [Pantoea rwandensis]|uniref:Uncharacterized protein n=1 Tax=Pantoea rwandensis TaxID=1076550 RepID=A0A1X1CX47_9GAMM|nr:hypothetical protein [Pantoea rwandensis]ORM68927.1 hypothetical protein HA51_13180 [Pantoea rwandensis]
MNVIKFPNPQQQQVEHSQLNHEIKNIAVRDFALKIATQLRNDDELNSRAPYLVDKVIMLLIKESRGVES